MKRAQSAMEYLVTYGWAILLIAIVIGLLFKLGLFTSSTFTSRVQPGSCLVDRPFGPNTTKFISLSGLCTGAFPEYVSSIQSQDSFWQGAGPHNPQSTQAWTLTAWIAPVGSFPLSGEAVMDGNELGGFALGIGNGFGTVGANVEGMVGHAGGTSILNSGFTMPAANKWYFVAIEYNGVAISFYVNGQQTSKTYANSAFSINSITDFNITVGAEREWNTQDQRFFPGLVSNVQLYNNALTAADISTLYIDGIGGAPIQLTSLVGWWPMNGNGNDYSGNGANLRVNPNTGAESPYFTAQWTTYYSPP
jgi:hypothetical protein